mmetsp:Transcript_7174/g.25604  ORF Transcript_7174/g.25604 Transcript_7174/m.25604 type:complete len:201 (+) Transcript_7174:4884-5486(+)
MLGESAWAAVAYRAAPCPCTTNPAATRGWACGAARAVLDCALMARHGVPRGLNSIWLSSAKRNLRWRRRRPLRRPPLPRPPRSGLRCSVPTPPNCCLAPKHRHRRQARAATSKTRSVKSCTLTGTAIRATRTTVSSARMTTRTTFTTSCRTSAACWASLTRWRRTAVATAGAHLPTTSRRWARRPSAAACSSRCTTSAAS